jgi:hypothetical protein
VYFPSVAILSEERKIMADGNQIRVKFVYRGQSDSNAAIWLRQFPQQKPVWGNCLFILDPTECDYDWLVVSDDLPIKQAGGKSSAVENLACPPQHTLFITREPSSISTYGSDFLKQFGYVLTGQEEWAIRHPGKIHSQPALRWYYGASKGTGGQQRIDYDYMTTHPPQNKTKLISTVCSAKQQKHTLHYQRVQFVEKLCREIPELDRFGLGVREINDKAEALDAYRYHIAIENHIAPHWWTEKLADSFLGLTLPFYFGAPNAADYFPAESFIPIDIRNFDESLRTIRTAIANNEYEKRLPAIQEARRRVLDQYNTFAVLSELIEARHNPSAEKQQGCRIYSRHALRRNPIKAIRIGLEKSCMRIRSMINQRD